MICTTCKLNKNVEYFWRANRLKSGYCGQCISCIKKYRERKDVKQRQVRSVLKYYHRIKKSESYIKRTKKYYEIYKEKSPEKFKARGILRQAIRSGKIKRGNCEVCKKPNGEAHHSDYSKPLQVKWLCRRHHTDLHIANII